MAKSSAVWGSVGVLLRVAPRDVAVDEAADRGSEVRQFDWCFYFVLRDAGLGFAVGGIHGLVAREEEMHRAWKMR